jgi:periplasmic divalent cation tolerance protein
MADVLMVYVTCKDKAEAQKIAAHVIGSRLAACANIFAPHSAVYEWKGEIQHEEETAMILKTSADKLGALKEAVIEMHSYDNPCVVAIDICDGAAPFMQWIIEQTS